MLLKKALFSMFLLCPLVAWGQLLSVTATLTDSDSIVWANATCAVQVYSPNGTPFFGATPVPTATQACSVNGSGVLSTSIYNTSTITPTGAQYRFNINSATSAPGVSFLTPVTAANMTTTLVAAIAPTPPRFSAAIAFAYGYADVEAIATNPGGQYYKTVTTTGQRIWSGSAWTAGGGGGGGCTANCTFTGTTNVSTLIASDMTVSSAATGSTNFTITNSSGAGKTWIGFVTGSGAGTYGQFCFNDSTDSFTAFCISPFEQILSSSQTGVTWSSGSAFSSFADTGLYRLGPANIALGDGGVGGVNGTLTLANVVANTHNIVAGNSNTPTVNQAACIKAVGPPILVGTCSTVVGAGGACTCN